MPDILRPERGTSADNYLQTNTDTYTHVPGLTLVNETDFTELSSFPNFDFRKTWYMSTQSPILRNDRVNFVDTLAKAAVTAKFLPSRLTGMSDVTSPTELNAVERAFITQYSDVAVLRRIAEFL